MYINSELSESPEYAHNMILSITILLWTWGWPGNCCGLIVQVGAKSRNIANLMGKLPSWIRLPTSVAVPFGVFEKVLTESVNKVCWLSIQLSMTFW